MIEFLSQGQTSLIFVFSNEKWSAIEAFRGRLHRIPRTRCKCHGERSNSEKFPGSSLITHFTFFLAVILSSGFTCCNYFSRAHLDPPSRLVREKFAETPGGGRRWKLPPSSETLSVFKWNVVSSAVSSTVYPLSFLNRNEKGRSKES